MKVNIKYNDTESISPEEIKGHAKSLYGDSAQVTISPDSEDAFNLLYFAIQQHITIRQVHSFYDDGILYEEKLKTLKKEVLDLVGEAFSQVVSDNEDKLT